MEIYNLKASIKEIENNMELYKSENREIKSKLNNSSNVLVDFNKLNMEKDHEINKLKNII